MEQFLEQDSARDHKEYEYQPLSAKQYLWEKLGDAKMAH
jgi:hypothetical protein